MIRRLPAPLDALVLPLLIVGGGIIATAVLATSSPGRIAVHWDLAGEPDGYAGSWTVVAVTAVVGIGLVTLLTVLLLTAGQVSGRLPGNAKLVAVVLTGAVALITALGIWMLVSQGDGGPAPGVGGGLAIGFLSALLAGILAAVILPRAASVRGSDPEATPPIALGSQERVVWSGIARMSTSATVAIGLGVIILLAVVAVAVIRTDGAAWPVLVVPAGLGALMLSLTEFRVRIDDAGLTVRSALGLPAWRIPTTAIASAGVIEVAPLGDFGGWGVRLGRGRRTGVITRAGSALQVRRRSGRALVVTVDDAGAAAAVLNALAGRSAGS